MSIIEKIRLGSNRPFFHDFMQNVNGYILCPCGSMLQTRQSSFEHWQLGHFDIPVYATKEEVLDKLAEKLAKTLVIKEERIERE